MDRFLRSLLTSSAGASMEAEKSLSEIARAVLVDRPEGDPRSLREKAGLLALLNLLGIVEAFYGVPDQDRESAPKPKAAEPAKGSELTPMTGPAPARAAQPPLSQAQPGQAAPAAPALAPDSPLSMVSALARLMATAASSQTTQTGPQAGAPAAAGTQAATSPAGPFGGFDPTLIASVLGLMSGLAKPRLPRPPTKVEGEPVEATAGGSKPDAKEGGETEAAVPGAERTAEAGNQPVSDTGEAVPDLVTRGPAATGPLGLSQATPPSPLQQVLGVDPKVLTLVLNLVAELMKSRAGEQKEKAAESKPEKDDRKVEGPVTPPLDTRGAVPMSPRRSLLGPRLYHKPGLGIYRSAQRVPKPAPARARED